MTRSNTFARVTPGFAALVALFGGAPGIARSAEINVPQDFPGIQQAIDAASDGDTVRVSQGTYFENIRFNGKAITVVSRAGANLTTINGGGMDSVVVFSNGEGADSVLRGFTLTNGNAVFQSGGGGIRSQNSSPTVVDNIITANTACAGAGILLNFSSAEIRGNQITGNFQSGCSGGVGGGGISILGAGTASIIDNVISENQTGADGGGIALFAAGNPTITGNIIERNASFNGGGLSLVNFSDALIVQNTIAGNVASTGGGVYYLVPSGARGPLLVSNTIVDNDGNRVSGIFAEGFDADTALKNNIIVARAGQDAVFCSRFFDPAGPMFSFNDVFAPSGLAYTGSCTDATGANGNISADPMFVDQAAGDYRLKSNSAAIDSGDNTVTELLSLDFEGDPRILDGNDDGVAVVDMGVDEFMNRFKAFAAFAPQLRVVGGGKKALVSIFGSFSLDASSNGFDPALEEFALAVDGTNGALVNQVVPAGRIRRIGSGFFFFDSAPGATGIQSIVIQKGKSKGQFFFFINAVTSNRSGSILATTVSIRLGDDTGSKALACKASRILLKCE